MVIVNLSEYLFQSFRCDRRLQKDVKLGVCEGLKGFDAMKNMCNIRNVCSSVERRFYKRVMD